LAITLVLPALTYADAARDAEVARQAEALRPKLIEMRRDFHMYPELSNREERTSRVIAERLRALGVEDVRTGVARYGVVGLIRRKAGPGDRVARGHGRYRWRSPSRSRTSRAMQA
jgi:amidohydrolase